MYKLINEHDFINAFKSWDTYKNSFSYDGLRALFEHLEEFDGSELGMELDVVSICCEYTEYTSVDACLEYYDHIKNCDELYENTTLLHLPKGRIIIRDF